MAERLRRLSHSQRRDKEIAKLARKIDVWLFYPREDLSVLRESASRVLGRADVDDFLSIQVVKFGRLPKDDPRREMGRVGFTQDAIKRQQSSVKSRGNNLLQ
jgi:hypothetical protein